MTDASEPWAGWVGLPARPAPFGAGLGVVPALGACPAHAGGLLDVSTTEVEMTYSLVSAPALGFDLARMATGEHVARVLLDALGCRPEQVSGLAARHPGRSRSARWESVRSVAEPPRVVSTLGLAATALDLAAAGALTAGEGLLTRLAHSTIGDLAALERLVRHDVLDWTWTTRDGVATQTSSSTDAADVLVDAAASAYAGDSLPSGVRRSLVAPYLTGRAGLHAPGPTPAVAALLADLSGWDAADRAAWRQAVDAHRRLSPGWAPAMHEASWAAHLSDRVRTAAAHQLHGVVAFRRAGFSAHDAAFGSWNALSGCLLALTVRDLLGDQDGELLLRPWVLARGRWPD